MSKLLEQLSTAEKINLGSVSHYVTDKVDISELSLDDYISTENMLSERGGITRATKLPNGGKVTKFKQGDVLTSNIRPYFKKIWQATRDGGCSNDVLAIRTNNPKELDENFLYYNISNDVFFACSMMSSQGTKMPRGDKDAIMKYEIPLPNLRTQKKIAEILSTYDAKIENNNKIIKNLEEMAQTIFNEWFVNFKFPGYEKAKMVNSEMGEIPEGWSIGNIETICNRLPSGKVFKENELSAQGLTPVYDQSSKGTIGFHAEEPAFNADIDNPILTFGDHTCRVQLICEPFSLGPNTVPLSEKSNYNPIFTFFLIKDLIEQREYKRHWSELVSNNLIVPNISLVNEYIRMIKPFVKQIKFFEKENLSLKSQRDQLLAKLI